MTTGADLFALVEAYDRLGTKRTGGPNEAAVIAWMRDRLVERGAIVRLQDYPVTHWREEISVVVDGEDVPAVTLPWSGVGEASDDAPDVRPIEMLAGLHPTNLDDVVAGVGSSSLVVLSTPSPRGHVIGVNRAPTPTSGPIVVMVGSNDAEAVADRGRVRVRTSVVEGRSTNIVATLGPDDGRAPVVLVTPLSGWFHCAGERGCGIALTLEMASRIAVDRPVEVVATTGHETGYVGSDAVLAERRTRPAAVVHFGASLAAVDMDASGEQALSDKRFAMVDAAGLPGLADAVAEALADAGMGILDVPEWPGEGGAWRRWGAPVLSMTGAFDLFHTPADRTHDVTTPAALTEVWTATCRAIDSLLVALLPTLEGSP